MPTAVIRLHPEDAVVIARSTLLPGVPVAPGVTAAERARLSAFERSVRAVSSAACNPSS